MMTGVKSAFRMAPQVIATGILVTLIFSFAGPWNAMRWIGLAITVFAAVLFLMARYQLGTSFSVSPQAKQLVTSGIYSLFATLCTCSAR
jgi:protein-S-isoprenylcysteine O-methyltransferase Ste14